MNLENFPSLHVFKINLPLLRFLANLVELCLQIGDLVLSELLQRTHDLLDSCHFLRQSIIGHASVLN